MRACVLAVGCPVSFTLESPLSKLNRRSRLALATVIERLELRQLLSATLSVDHSLMVFNAVRNSSASPIETLTLTNTGDAPLTLGSAGVSIVNDPASPTA